MSDGQRFGTAESDDSVDDQPRGDATEPRGQHRWNGPFGATLIVFMVAIVAIPISFAEFSDASGRWSLAFAWEQRLDGDVEAAIDTLDAALANTPTHVECFLQRAAWNAQLGNTQAALDDYEQIHQLVGNDPRMLEGRAMAYHRAGRKAEAIRDLKVKLEGSQGVERAVQLNMLAYFRALNDSDLEQALEDINTAIELSLKNAKLSFFGVKVAITEAEAVNPAYLDTRGFIRYKLGDFESAHGDFEKAVQGYAKSLALVQASASRKIDPRVARIHLNSVRANYAVIVYHRGLNLEKLGETERAEADFLKVRALGFEPNDDLF